MPASFLHGFETLSTVKGPLATRLVRTAVIGLVGTAADGPVNAPVVVSGPDEAEAQFGAFLEGGTIRPALKAIWDKGLCPVVVVNVLDPATHKTDVAAADFALGTAGVAALAHGHVSAVVVKDQAGDTTYVEDTDYTLDAVAGTVTRISGGAIAAEATVSIAYSYLDTSKVLSTDIIGTVNGSGDRTGAQAWLGALSQFGFGPKILIAPGFSSQQTVMAALDVLADKLRAVALIDAPLGTTVAVAIQGRGTTGTINFQTSSKRLFLCYPYLEAISLDGSGDTVLEPYSQHMAGVMAANDLANGYWSSPSNKPLTGVTGVERLISQSLRDATADNQALNEVGITTYYSEYGTGLRTFGNRSAAWPSSSDPDVFLCVRRTADVIEDSIELSMLDVLDKPITQGLIDGIVQRVTNFIQTLIGRGALVDGWVKFDPSKNPSAEIAAGHLTFTYGIAPPPPFERGTFEQVLDTTLLAALASPQPS